MLQQRFFSPAWIILFVSTPFFTLSAKAGPAVSLKIQDVIQQVLDQGLYKKDIDINYQRSEIPWLLTESSFDTQMIAKVQNEDSRAESLTTIPNDRDQTQSWIFGVSRRFSTGTTLSYDYSFIHRDSDLSAFARSNNVSPEIFYHQSAFTIKQDLFNNAFGYRDRRLLLSADLQTERAKLERDEATEELLLQTIKVFLDAFTAQENLKQSLAARDKYQLLLKSIQQKHRMGFDDKSELTKTKAEIQNQEKNVLTARMFFDTLITKLYTFLNSNPPPEVQIDVPETISPPDKNDPKFQKNTDTDHFRKTQSSDVLVRAAEADNEAAQNNKWAQLNVFGQASYNGLDPANDTALTEMNHQDHPKYTVGLEFQMKWGGSSQKAEKLSKMLAHEEALNNQRKTKNDLLETLGRTQTNLKTKFDIVSRAEESVKLWEDTIKSQESNHRYGRITTTELILDYTNYFRTKASLSSARADYQMALYEYQAARDQLYHKN